MQFDRSKLRDVILHVCQACAPDRLGAVKLHKVLYFLDMIFYAQAGRAVTGAEYRKRPFGPTCVSLLPVLREMERDGVLAIDEVDFHGRAKKQYRALAVSDLKRFDDAEIELLDEVIEFVCNQNTAKSISDYSHQLPWEMADFGDVIGYDTALLLFPSEPSAEALDLVEAEAEGIEAARSQGDFVGHSTYRDFRGRVLAEIGRG